MARSTTSVCVETYAGIDYHKKFSVVTLGDKNGVALRTERIPNDATTVRQFFKQYPGLICAVESCRGYEWFVELLQSLGLEVEICNPYAVKLITHSRCKTDRIDSKILMELLAKGYLPTCYQPSPEERALREKLRWRIHLVRSVTRIKLQIHCLLDKENLTLLAPKLFSAKGKAYLSAVQLASPNRQQLLKEQMQLLEHLECCVNQADKQLKQLATQSEDAQLLLSIPGIGTLSALVIIAELGAINRFKRSEAVVSYAGLAPRVYSSAETRHTGPITKQGSRWLRWVLIQDAWIAIRCSPQLRYYFVSVSRRCGRHTAIVGVARKLLQIAYRVLRDRRRFDPDLVGKPFLEKCKSQA